MNFTLIFLSKLFVNPTFLMKHLRTIQLSYGSTFSLAHQFAGSLKILPKSFSNWRSCEQDAKVISSLKNIFLRLNLSIWNLKCLNDWRLNGNLRNNKKLLTSITYLEYNLECVKKIKKWNKRKFVKRKKNYLSYKVKF